MRAANWWGCQHTLSCRTDVLAVCYLSSIRFGKEAFFTERTNSLLAHLVKLFRRQHLHGLNMVFVFSRLFSCALISWTHALASDEIPFSSRNAAIFSYRTSGTVKFIRLFLVGIKSLLWIYPVEQRRLSHAHYYTRCNTWRQEKLSSATAGAFRRGRTWRRRPPAGDGTPSAQARRQARLPPARLRRFAPARADGGRASAVRPALTRLSSSC